MVGELQFCTWFGSQLFEKEPLNIAHFCGCSFFDPYEYFVQ